MAETLGIREIHKMEPLTKILSRENFPLYGSFGMYHVNEMTQGEEVCTIQTSFEDLRLYFCLVTGRQASGVHASP